MGTGTLIEARFPDRRRAEEARRQLQLAGVHDEQKIEIADEGPPLLELLVPEAERSTGAVVRVRDAADPGRAASVMERLGGTLLSRPERVAEAEGDRTIDIVEEELEPRVVPVQVGEVRIRKRVVTEVRTIEVPVRREEVVVERMAAVPEGGAERHPAPSELGADEEVTRVPLWEERVEVSKHLVVREELIVRKRRRSEVQTVTEEVRREVPTLETEGDFVLHDESERS